jgi:hypothetical protein
MATPQDERDDDLDTPAFAADRPGPHPVDVLGDLPVDGEPVAETQLMPDAELDSDAVEGDRFDVGDDDVGMQPDLETEPDAPDLRPDAIKRFDGDREEDVVQTDDEMDDEQITARPSGLGDDVEPVETPEAS